MKNSINTPSSSRIGPVLALSYLYLPFLLFDLGWIRLSWSIPIAVVSLAGFVLTCRRMPALWIPSWSWRTTASALLCALVLGLWVWSAGIGGYVWGNIDHLERNTVFKMLVERSGPLYSMGTLGIPPDAEPSIMSYYIGFYLPAALVGKLTSLRVAFFALWCWSFFGICLVYYLLCAKLKRLMVWPVLVFVFFSGADAIGVILRNLNHPGAIPFWSPVSNFEQWSAYNYSCQTSHLYWAYNQVVPAWIATMLLLCGIPASCSLFVASTLMINATFPFVGLCVLAGAFAWVSLPDADKKPVVKKVERWIQSFLSVPNIIGPVVIGIPSFLYLSENTAGSHFSLRFHYTYFLFVLFEVVVLVLPFIRSKSRDVVFWTVFVTLLLLPFGKVGYGSAGDFYVRTSIPFLFVIMFWYVNAIFEAIEKHAFRNAVVPVAILLLGIATPLHEMSRTFVRTRENPDIRAYWAKHNEPEWKIMHFGRYYGTAPIKGSRFCKFLAKDPSNE